MCEREYDELADLRSGAAGGKLADLAEKMPDEETLADLADKMPDEETLADLADLYQLFSDSTRVRILALLGVSPLCVGDIAAVLNMTPSAISHQLRLLKQARLVRARRDGKSVVYALSDDHVATILAQGLEHIGE